MKIQGGCIMMNVNVLLFPEFETLDAFGPVEVFGRIPEYRLHYVSIAGGMITSKQKMQVLTESIREIYAPTRRTLVTSVVS